MTTIEIIESDELLALDIKVAELLATVRTERAKLFNIKTAQLSDILDQQIAGTLSAADAKKATAKVHADHAAARKPFKLLAEEAQNLNNSVFDLIKNDIISIKEQNPGKLVTIKPSKFQGQRMVAVQ